MYYTDLGSSNGTSLNGKDLEEHDAAELNNGDCLLMGDTLLSVAFTVHGAA